MKIKHVEELVGITGKNIRFYEQQGLLAPKRAENGYREYGQEDVDRLLRIKLLRKLGVPIESISALLRGDIRLEDCLDRHLDELDRQKENLIKMQAVTSQIIASHCTLQSLDTDSCLEQVEKLEKEGVHFMEVEKKDRQRKKRTGAVVAAVLILMVGIVIPMGLLLWVNTMEQIPVGVFIGYILISTPMAAAILVVLAKRMKEIKGGEEDEAVKY